MPWGGNDDEAPHDTQEDSGTSQGQMYTTGQLRCGVPGPMQELSMRLHKGDGGEVREKEHKQDVKTLEEKKYTRSRKKERK